MNEQKTNRKNLWVALAAALALAAAFAFVADRERSTPPDIGQKAGGAMAAFIKRPDRPQTPDISFVDETGNAKSLKDFRGKVLLVNLWATWCAPCRAEMPDLDALQKALGSQDFQVLAISLDTTGITGVQNFLHSLGATSIVPYIDQSGQTPSVVQAPGLPTTLLIDRQGREIGRLIGPAKWNAPEAQALIKAVIAVPAN